MPSATRRRQSAPRDPNSPAPAPLDPAELQARRVRTAVAWTIAVVAALLYLRMVVNEHDFVLLEDYRYVVESPVVRGGLSRESLAQVPTAVLADNWHPVTLLSHMFDMQVFGGRATGHHAMSLLLHAANAGLLFYVLARLTGSVWPSAFAAALFACHPLAVEPVAWIAARKDVLSTLFWLLAMWAYLAYVERPRSWRYALLLLVFALGLMSKPMLVTFPFVLLLLDFWPLRRLPDVQWRSPEWRKAAGVLLREKLPLLALAWLSCVITLWVHWTHNTAGQISWTARISHAVQSYYVYLREAIWPSPLYVPHLSPNDTLVGWPMVVLGVLGLVLATAASLWAARKRPYLTVGWLWYLGTLVPVLGLVQIGFESYPDRFAYLPLIGIFIAVAWAIDELARRSVAWRRAATVGAVMLVAALAAATFQQQAHWQNTITLCEHTVAHSSNNLMAHVLLGNGYYAAKRYDDALEQLDRAVVVAPYVSRPHYNRGQVLLARGNESLSDFQEAAKSFDIARHLRYDQHASYIGLATAKMKLERYDEAEQHAQQALRLKPDSLPAMVILAGVATTRNDAPDAVEWYRRAIKLSPNQPPLLISLARIYATCEIDGVRRGVAALELAQRANTLTNYSDPYMIETLAAAFAERGRFAEAEEASGWGLQMAETLPNQDSPELQEMIAKLKEHIELFRAKQPLREPINLRDPVLP